MVIEILSEEMELPFEDLVFGKCGLGHGEVEFRRANPDGEPAEEGGSMAFLAGGMVPDQATNLFSLVMSHGKILEETQVVVLQADYRRELRLVVEKSDENVEAVGISLKEVGMEVLSEDFQERGFLLKDRAWLTGVDEEISKFVRVIRIGGFDDRGSIVGVIGERNGS